MKLISNHPIAADSPDHLHPFGAARDNSRNREFNRRLYALLEIKSLFILDIGCAGGGFVKDCVEDGHEAFGIEGTDYCLQNELAEWVTIPDRLFTCDATQPFHFENEGVIARFDVITAWEVLEHIAESRLEGFLANVRANLKWNGLFIVSIPSTSSHANGIEYHQTIQPPEWWGERLRASGWKENRGVKKYFGGQFVRGAQDYSENWVLEP